MNPVNEEEVRLDAYLARKPPKRPHLCLRKTLQSRSVNRSRLKSETKSESPIYVIPFNGITIKEEIFIVSACFMSQGIPIYELKDILDDPILGTFYASELQKVNKNEETIWRIDRILRKRKKDGKNEVLVRWLGWPKKFDSWILEKDIKET